MYILYFFQFVVHKHFFIIIFIISREDFQKKNQQNEKMKYGQQIEPARRELSEVYFSRKYRKFNLEMCFFRSLECLPRILRT